MSISGILSSKSQRNFLLIISILIILIISLTLFIIWYLAPDTRGWNIIIDFIIAIIASSIFALSSTLFIYCLFKDPFDVASASKVLPQDIGGVLMEIARDASVYRLFVRTGRHFRAEILPELIKGAKKSRNSIRIEAVLLDFRDEDICEKYATYRKNASFDSKVWSKAYVQKEVLATILKLYDAAKEYSSLIYVDIYLSKRLSIFRIDGSQEEIIITREDPKDIASRYRCLDSDYAAFVKEFDWTRDAADKIENVTDPTSPSAALEIMLGKLPQGRDLLVEAKKAKSGASPYVR